MSELPSNPPESFKARNRHLWPDVGTKALPAGSTARKMGINGLRLVIYDQIMGGKNNMGISRSGRHYPKPKWAKWRDKAVRGIKEQLPNGFKTITEPCDVRLDYISGDKRRRDQPAIFDAIFHVLERAGVVSDDSLIWVNRSTRTYDKDSPRAEITFYP